MRNNWSYFMDSEGGYSDIFPMDPLLPQGFGAHLLSHIVSFVDNSKYLYVPGSLALQEAFNCVSKFAGALLIWLAHGQPNSKIDRRISGNPHGSNPSNYKSNAQVKHVTSQGHNFTGFLSNYRSKGKSGIPLIFAKISRFSMKQLCKEAQQLRSFPALSLAAALIPPFDNVCPDVLVIPLETGAVEAQGCMTQRPSQVENQGCSDFSFQCLSWTSHAVEPRTGIEFPTVLENMVAGVNTSNFTSEVNV